MNKKILLFMFATFVLITSGFIYLLSASSNKNEDAGNKSASSPQSIPDNATTNGPSDKQVGTAGRYIDYSESAITNTSGTKILFFHAAWCPQCRALEADIKQKGVPAGVTIIKVDYDSNQSLRKKYGVSLQTTLVKIDENGNSVKKFVAYDDPSLEAVVQNLL